MRRSRRWYRRHITKTAPTVPNHGGTPAEMLNDLASFLDKLDDAGMSLVIDRPGHRFHGRTLYDILNPGIDGEPPRTMQADVRWLANILDQDV